MDRTLLYRDPELRALVDTARGQRADRQRRMADESAWPAPPALRARVQQACDELESSGNRFTVSEVAQLAGVGRKTLYRYADLRELVEARRAQILNPGHVDLASEVAGLWAEIQELRATLIAQEAELRQLRDAEEAAAPQPAPRRNGGNPARQRQTTSA